MKNALRISLIAIISVLMLSAATAGGKKPAWVVGTEMKAKRSGDVIIGWGEYKRNFFEPKCYYVVAHGGYPRKFNALGDPIPAGRFVKVYMSSLLDYCTASSIDYGSERLYSHGETLMISFTDQTPANLLAREVTNKFSEALVDVALVDSMRVKK